MGSRILQLRSPPISLTTHSSPRYRLPHRFNHPSPCSINPIQISPCFPPSLPLRLPSPPVHLHGPWASPTKLEPQMSPLSGTLPAPTSLRLRRMLRRCQGQRQERKGQRQEGKGEGKEGEGGGGELGGGGVSGGG
ncbi:hypothetical protein FA95DRAFT_491347 [Auriscalpium vulgare]|uniref:Uncharacterized protein n=1 Tax=Auriscalpium vulgare TaxID=40419 RepID=A0ACB8S329_9AGAM|nr:hypothetical protein FA95DRAFT_491347 [Auriscalpium vulgare]